MSIEKLLREAEKKKSEAAKPKLEIVSQPNQRNQPNIPNQPKVANQRNQPKIPNVTNPIAPEKDFSKVANSIAREAVPDRLFKGMSKNTYDALYLKTRGAISPVRKIRATKSDLIRWTGVSDVTLDKHLKHLKSVGLVKWDFIIGSHDGNWYEVFIPEEIDLANIPNLPNQPNPDNLPKKVGGLVPNFLGGVGGVELYENKEVTENPKTLFKTNTNDDEAFAILTGKLAKATEKITGRKPTAGEAEKWGTLADLLILELEVAASRADSVSSVPAFLTEVLRRQFFAARREGQQSTSKPSKTKPDTVGKNEAGDYEIKSLDSQGREAALEQLREFAGEEFLEDFKKWYTPEDWKWLTAEFKTSVTD